MSSPLLTRVYLEGHRHAFASVDKPIGTLTLSEKISDLPIEQLNHNMLKGDYGGFTL